MARIVDGPLPKRYRYPWAEWTDGNWWEIRRGVDFEISPTSMKGTLWMWAKRHDLKVDSQQRGDIIRFQFVNRE